MRRTSGRGIIKEATLEKKDAVAAAKAKAKSIHCVSNEKQVMLATKLYLDDNGGTILPLWINTGAGGFVTNDPVSFSIQSPFYWWADKLRLDGYGAEKGVLDCPALTSPATKASGGLYSSVRTLGIGRLGCGVLIS